MIEDERALLACEAARAGAAVADRSFRTGVAVETKGGKTDVVTASDREAQARVVEVIRDRYPEATIVGEEDGVVRTVPESGRAWIVDPIDGTNNYVRDIRIWATAVAHVVDGEPVAAAIVMPAIGDEYAADSTGAYRNGEPIATSEQSDPELGVVVPTMWWAFDDRAAYSRATGAIVERFADLRRFGCAQGALSLLAAGSVEGVLTNIRANPWDTVAGAFLVRQAGGTVTDLEGDRWRHDSKGLVASNGPVHDEVLAAARAIEAL